MANYKMIFYGSEVSETEDHELTCSINDRNEIYIDIDTQSQSAGWIVLDKSTAIKFAKALRTEINKIQDNG